MIKMTDKICPECGTQQDDSFSYCKNCGALLSGENENSDDMQICPECGAREEKSSKFCKNCGNQFGENKNDDGANFTKKCSSCGALLNDEMYCPDCGEPTGIKTCPKCRQKTVDQDFCSNCGYQLNKSVKICSNCGSKFDSKAKVCPNCGGEVIYRNPIVALVLSFIFPGLGQLYNHQNRKGIILIVANVISLILCLLLIGIILVILIWIYSMYDAFASAKAMNNGEFVEDRIF